MTPPPHRAKGVDWPELHRLVDGAFAKIMADEGPGAGEASRILEDRARRLALAPDRNRTAPDTVELVEFLAAHEHYGVEMRFVRQIHALRAYTPVPGAPPFYLGVVHLRGLIVPVLDLKRVFGLPERGLTELDRVIVLESEGLRLGLLASAVPGVQELPRADFQTLPPTLSGIRAEFARGVTTDGLTWLDAGRLLKSRELVASHSAEELEES